MFLRPNKVVSMTLLLAVAFWFSFQKPALAEGQNPMDFKEFYVDVWPEYDDPRVLVIYKGKMINNSSITVKQGEFVYFNIPKGADIGMACETDGSYGSHSCLPFGIEDKDDYQVLRWRISRDINPGEEYPVFLEFYYNPIQGEVDKSFNSVFTPAAGIKFLEILIQQPLKATNFKAEPAAMNTLVDQGFTNHIYNFNDVTKDTRFEIAVSYSKSDPNPSIQRTENTTPALQSGDPQGAEEKSPLIKILGYSIGLVVLIFAITQFSNNKRSKKGADKKSKRTRNGNSNSAISKEKRKLREMLLNGEISEDTYRELMDEFENK